MNTKFSFITKLLFGESTRELDFVFVALGSTWLVVYILKNIAVISKFLSKNSVTNNNYLVNDLHSKLKF